MPLTTPAPAADTPLLTDEARSLLTRRLTWAKGRADVEILAVTGVAYGQYIHGMQTRPGVEFTVEFTYTTGRRQRRTAEVGWPIGIYTTPAEQGTDRDPNMPAALWDMLTNALAVAARLPGQG